jgi:lysyl-tRNA synthetase class 2
MTEQSSNSADENRLIQERREKLGQIRQQGNAFPNNWERQHLATDLQQQFGDQAKEDLEQLDHQVSIAGRIMARRGPFMVIQDMSGQIQAYASKDVQSAIKDRWGQWDIGDIVGVQGPLHKSGKGDLYVNMSRYELLTKSLRPLPEKYAGLTDTETRYRQRYVDLIVNEESRNIFKIRSHVIEYIRKYFSSIGYLEVETPMLQQLPGGATARPFATHHNALDIDMYLRVAPELFLKRLVVGGFEKVFEINRNFRNEGLSTRHNPEFTMLEFYQAYASFETLMDLTEDMLRGLAKNIHGSTKVRATKKNADGEVESEENYDFGQPFRRIKLRDAIIEFNPHMDVAALVDLESASELAKGLGVRVEDSWGLGKVQLEIFEKTVEHRLLDPTFVTAYPAEVSPLARRNDDDPFITDRFELFIGGREIANGFSELNDPEDQAERFKAQAEAKAEGDLEAMYYDADYIRALEYGLPPTAGEGIGIDRLVMLLTDSPSIRDVLLFPAMRPE